MYIRRIILLTVGLLCTQSVLCQNECTKEAVETCIEPLRVYDLEYRAIFPQLFEAELDLLCEARKDTERCLKSFKRDCDRFQRRHFEGLEEAYDYICSNSARRIYFKNWHCLDNRKLVRRVRKCNETYQDSLRSLRKNVHSYTFKEIKEQRCSHLNTYLSCIKTEMEDTGKCVNSNEIAAWQYKIHKLALKGLAKAIDCEITEPLLTTAEIVGIVIGGVAFIVLVILLIYFCTCNVSRYRRRHAQIDSQEKKPVKPGKIPSVKVLPPEDNETEEEEEEEEDEESSHDKTYESFPNQSFTTQHNGQLSSRTRESLKLQLPVTPTSARKPNFTKSSDFDETQSEASRSLPPPVLPAKKARSKRGDKRRSARDESDTETDLNTSVKIF